MPSARDIMLPSGGGNVLVPRSETWSVCGLPQAAAKPEERALPPPKYQPRSEVLQRSKLPASGGYNARSRRDQELAPEAEEMPTLIPDFYITVDRSEGRSLGIEVITEGGLMVMSINEGLIQDWNTANPEQAVEEQDRIVGANDVEDDVDLILEQCKQSQLLKLKVRR